MELFLRPVGTVLPKTADVSIVLDADGEYRYYIDGVAQKGWQTIEGNKYYFSTKSGLMLKDGTYVVGSKQYTFDANGKLVG